MGQYLRGVFVAATVLVVACDGSGPEIVVDLRTDFRPGDEFRLVETTLSVPSDPTFGRTQDIVVDSGVDFLGGSRVAEFGGLTAGPYRVEMYLRDADGVVVGRRSMDLEVNADEGITVVIQRSCGGIICPGTGDPPEASECVSGACVEQTCTPGDVGCEIECVADAECAVSEPCETPRCAGSLCLVDRSSCGVGDGGVDAGPDATTDAAAVDSSVLDASSDGGVPDGSLDATTCDASVACGDPATGTQCGQIFDGCRTIECGGCGTQGTCVAGSCVCTPDPGEAGDVLGRDRGILVVDGPMATFAGANLHDAGDGDSYVFQVGPVPASGFRLVAEIDPTRGQQLMLIGVFCEDAPASGACVSGNPGSPISVAYGDGGCSIAATAPEVARIVMDVQCPSASATIQLNTSTASPSSFSHVCDPYGIQLTATTIR